MPSLPDDVVARTRDKYLDAYRPADGPDPALGPTVRELLLRLVDQMVDGGIRFEDGRREFERRFIERALADTDGHLSETADEAGHPPEHPGPENG